MAQEVGAKSAPTGCCDCFGKRKKEPPPTPIPHHVIHSARRYTPKDMQDFAKLVKADEIETREEDAGPTDQSDEKKNTDTVFKKIHPIRKQD